MTGRFRSACHGSAVCHVEIYCCVMRCAGAYRLAGEGSRKEVAVVKNDAGGRFYGGLPVRDDEIRAAGFRGAMREQEMSPNYVVLVNNEAQYSIWPCRRTIPVDWREAGKSGTKAECLSFIIKSVWMESFRPDPSAVG
jgi:MbtH protein